MKPWWKLVRPKQDIIDGESVDLGVFAIHLDQIAAKSPDAPEIYRDPKEFFKNTVFTKGMMKVIRHVHNRLSGNVDSGSVINLTTVFGGGKTHTLVMLMHLFENGETVRKWLPMDGLDDVSFRISEVELPKARVITWVGSNYSHNKPDDNGMCTPWGQILGQLGPEALEVIKPYEEDMTRPDTDTIRKLLSDGQPTLFLLDEILNAMEDMRGVEIGETTLNNQFRQFYHNLTIVASSMTKVSIVNSFSKSEGNVSEKDLEDLELLQNVSGRVDELIETATGYEISHIIRRRLFEEVKDPKDQKEITKNIKVWIEWTIKNKEQIVLDLQLGELEEAFEASYPFHPRILQVFEKKWQGLNSFGRTRGVLRMLSLWVREAYLTGTKENQRHTLITLGHAPLDNEMFANVVYGQLGTTELAIPINSDVTGEKAWATVLDHDSSPTIKQIKLHQQVGTIVFFESTGGQKQEFASTGEIRWSLCGPEGAEFSDIDTCLSNLENTGHYFRSKNKNHRISTKATLNKIKKTERSSVSEPDIDDLIKGIAKDEIKKGKDIDVHLFPRYAEDVPDTQSFKLCVLPPDLLPGSEEGQALGVAKQIIDQSKRTYKRHLAFLTTVSGKVKLSAIARDHLTYQAIKNNLSSYQLEDSDKEMLPMKLKETLDALKDEVWASYRKLYLVNSDGSLEEKDILGLLNRSMSQYGLATVVEERLKQHDIITILVSHRVLEHWPPVFDGKPWPLQSLRDNVFQSEKATKARIISPEGLRKSIINWIKNKKAVLVSLNVSGAYSSTLADDGTSDIELPTLIMFDSDTGLLLPEQVPQEPSPNEIIPPEPTIGTGEIPVVGAETEMPMDTTTPETEQPAEPIELDLVFRVPIKRINSVIMAMTMNFEDTDVKVEFSGKARKGLTQDPVINLTNTINQSGGNVESKVITKKKDTD